jgi:hypothetical protein
MDAIELPRLSHLGACHLVSFGYPPFKTLNNRSHPPLFNEKTQPDFTPARIPGEGGLPPVIKTAARRGEIHIYQAPFIRRAQRYLLKSVARKKLKKGREDAN